MNTMTYISYERCNAKIYFFINISGEGGGEIESKKVSKRGLSDSEKYQIIICSYGYIRSVKFIPPFISFNYFSLCRE